MKIAVSAAETSGDLIGSKLVQALKAQDHTIQIYGLAGEKMKASGCEQLWDQKQVDVMGFTEVLKKLPALLRLRNAIANYLIDDKPDVFIGIDAPDFNFALERKLKARGIKTIHFISPSVWAWRQSRIKKIKQSSDLILCVFPFEVDFYHKHQQKALFVGHPLAQSLTPRVNHTPGKNILLMPGSRHSEVKRLLPEMVEAVRRLKEDDNELAFNLVLANNTLYDWALEQVKGMGISLSVGDAHDRIRQSDLVLVASGTASLEVALIGVPMVVVYKLSTLSYWIASALIKSPYVSLPNVIAGKSLVPELIQKQANGVSIARHATQILQRDNQYLVKEFANIHAQLTCNTDQKSVQAIMDLVNE